MANFRSPEPLPNRDASPRCRNCGAIADASFCPKCGQPLKDRNRSIWSFARDFFSNLLATDSRALRTLFLLFLRPGVLTQENLRGRWQSYVPPFRLYLFLSLISFFALVGPFSDIDELSTKLKFNTTADGPNVVLKDSAEDSDQKADSATGAGQSKVADLEDVAESEEDLGWREKANRHIRDQNKKFQAMPPQEQVSFFLEQFLAAFPTFLVLFIPLFAMGLKILYLGSGRYLFEHLLFATHFISAALAVIAVGYFVPSPWVTKTLFYLYLPMYMIIAMRRVYGSSVWGILFRLPFILAMQFFISVFLIMIVSIYAFLQA